MKMNITNHQKQFRENKGKDFRSYYSLFQKFAHPFIIQEVAVFRTNPIQSHVQKERSYSCHR